MNVTNVMNASEIVWLGENRKCKNEGKIGPSGRTVIFYLHISRVCHIIHIFTLKSPRTCPGAF